MEKCRCPGCGAPLMSLGGMAFGALPSLRRADWPFLARFSAVCPVQPDSAFRRYAGRRMADADVV